MLTLKSSLLALALTAGLTLAAAPAMAACGDSGKPCGCAEKAEKTAGDHKDGYHQDGHKGHHRGHDHAKGGCGDEAGHKMAHKMADDGMDCCGKGGKNNTAAKDSRSHGKPGRAF